MQKRFLSLIPKIGAVILFIHSFAMYAQTVLSPGDMAFVAYSSSGTDFFAVVTFVDLQPCTKVYFTDNPYRIAAGFCTSGEEFCVSLTVTSRIPCGTVIRYNDGTPGTFTIPAGAGFITQEFIPKAGNNFGFSSGGDNIFAFQGTYAAPSFVCAIKSHPFNAAGTAACGDREDTELPLTLTNGLNALDLSGCTYGKYNCSVTSGSIAAIRAAINNDANWTNCATSFATGTICTSFTPTCSNCAGGPSSSASGISFTAVNCSTLNISWSRCNNMDVLAVLRDGSPVAGDPIDGVAYTPNVAFGSGSALGGGFVVSSGTSTSVNVTGLTGGNTYHVALYTFYPASGICYNSTEVTASVTMPACPMGFTFSGIWIENSQPSVLNWRTADESELDLFVPEFSQDGTSFLPFAQLQATNHPSQYQTPIPGSYPSGYVRIKIIEQNGGVSYSEVLNYKLQNSSINIFPNPANEVITVYSDHEPITLLEIFNLLGQRIQFVQIEDQRSSIDLDITHLQSGTYFVVAAIGGQRIHQPLLIQH